MDYTKATERGPTDTRIVTSETSQLTIVFLSISSCSTLTSTNNLPLVKFKIRLLLLEGLYGSTTEGEAQQLSGDAVGGQSVRLLSVVSGQRKLHINCHLVNVSPVGFRM
jgi:hypothetical protein